MRTAKYLKGEFAFFRFQLKSIRTVFFVPIVVILWIIPLLLFMTMEKYQNVVYVEEQFVMLSQYFIPLLSTWWLSFSFINLVEGSGNELHYMYHRLQDNLVLIWYFLYILLIVIYCSIVTIWIENTWLEFVRLSICSFFYISMTYAVMFFSHSMTVSFLVNILYWMRSTFGEGIPVELLNCYSASRMSIELLSQKYVYILLTGIVLYCIGWIANKRKEKYA